MSKKIFPTDSIFTLAVVVAGTAGKLTTSVPSFGVLADSTNGNVWPPSVDNKILTSEQLTGAVVVFATFQVMVWADDAGHDKFVLGCVTWNGPEVFVTVTTMSVNAVWPTLIGAVELYGELSLTVSLKFNVRETELNASIFAIGVPPGNGGVTKLPARIVAKIGKVLVGFAVAGNVSQLGPTSLPGLATLLFPVTVEFAASFCSQQ
mgnify:CR=1 FL=1